MRLLIGVRNEISHKSISHPFTAVLLFFLSSSDKTATITASMLISLAAAIVYILMYLLLLVFFGGFLLLPALVPLASLFIKYAKLRQIENTFYCRLAIRIS